MAGPPTSRANLDVYLLTLLLERIFPLKSTHRDDQDVVNRHRMRQLGILRLVCKHWYEAVGHCQLRLRICRENLRGFPEVRHERIGSLLASFAPGATAIQVDDCIGSLRAYFTPFSTAIELDDRDEREYGRARTQAMDVDGLAALQHLSTLRIGCWHGAWIAAERFTRLKELVISNCSKLDVTWLPSALPYLTQLTSFTFSCFLVPDEGFAGLGQLTRLKELSVIRNKINASVSTFSSLQRLERLDLQASYNLVDGPLAALSALENLRYLDLRSCWTLKELTHLHNTALTCLKLAHCKELTDHAIVQVAKLTTLESLDLSHTEIHNCGLKQLSSMTRLTDLNIGHVHNASIRGMQEVPCLRKLTRRDLIRKWYS